MKQISTMGLALIKEYEGLSLTPYPDPVGIPTIGYGATYYPDGKSVTLDDDTISKEEAERILTHHVNNVYGDAVNRWTEATQEQFDALTSFAYNVGIGALKKSTLLRKHNAGDTYGASEEFKRWAYADGKKLKGLVRRRQSEKELYLSQTISRKPH